MRLFVAFEIPENFTDSLKELQKKICAKVTFPKAFHLTLKFIGEVDDDKVGRIISGLDQVKFKSIDARLSEVGCFPDENRPRVVWLGIEPKDILTEIANKIESATKDFGISQRKEFVPHITLARIKHVDDRKGLQDSVHNLKPPEGSFPLTEFKLIKSTLTPEGPVYDVLKAFPAQQ